METFDKKINEVNKDPEFQTFMSYERDYEMCMNTDRKIAREEGHAKGLKEGVLESAKKFINSGMSKDEVAKILDIDIKQIDNK